jgi:hypothetical protein
VNHSRWEYKVLNVSVTWRSWRRSQWDQSLTETLNREGMQGWELVNSQWTGMQLNLIMKRPK